MRLSVCGGESGVPIYNTATNSLLISFHLSSRSVQNFVQELLLRSHLPSFHAICHQSCEQAVDTYLGPRRLIAADLNLTPTTQPELHYDRPASLTFVLT